ncbi:hypothetical protein [Parafrigoribacterium soli]|uniref:hypothetical protein n=1 Tax=Parafrigoribacterium soli TaxID=3144663 RepID=UPI0032EB6461
MRPDAAPRTAGKSTTLRRLAQPWTLILVTTGLFQLFRGAPIDAAFFLCIAALLLADALGWLRVSGAARPRAAWLLAAGIPLTIALVLAPRHSVVEGIIVSAIGLTVLVFAWGSAAGPTGTTTEVTSTPRTTMSPAVRRAAILWSTVGVVCCLWEVTSFLLGLPSPAAANAHPSISELFDPMLDSFEGRAAFTVLWLLLGVSLLRRRGRR